VRRGARLGLSLLRAGRGLALPGLLLAAAAGALLEPDATPLSSLRQVQFDHYQRVMPRPRPDEPVIIVGIDSASLQQYGQWPWSRRLIARLSAKILAGHPLALGIDIVFAEADRDSPALLGERLPGLPRQTLAALPDPDAELARVLASGPTVLACVGVANVLPGARQPEKPLPLRDDEIATWQGISRFPAAIVSRIPLEQAAAGTGLINASPDSRGSVSERGVLRRVPTLALVGEQAYLSLPLEMLRQALGPAGQVTPEFDSHGMRALRIGDYRLPTRASGELLLHYGKASSNYYLSAADVLAGTYPPEFFAARFVIIGFNSTGLQDSIITPLGEIVPGVDIHAQIIESALSGNALQRPWWLPGLELLVLLAGGLLLLVAVPRLQARFAVLAYAGLAALLTGTGYLAFFAGHWLFAGSSLALLLGPMFIALLGNTLVAADARRRQAEGELQQSREAAAHVAGELDAARRIQMGLLPDPQRRFAQEKRFSVAARLEPARAVGGDYYDCFMLDAKRLCLTIGDVSGKGVPASLFMAISKTLTGTLTRREADLGRAVRELEQELNRENGEFLFVTAFVGIFDADEGELEFVCAGHDAPLLLRNGEVSRIETAAHGGPPLCASEAFPYCSDRVSLLPGDLLCLFTDGITEASDGHAMFGTERLVATLRSQAGNGAAQTALALRDAVRTFESGQAPADDLTLLVLHYNGRPLSAG